MHEYMYIAIRNYMYAVNRMQHVHVWLALTVTRPVVAVLTISAVLPEADPFRPAVVPVPQEVAPVPGTLLAAQEEGLVVLVQLQLRLSIVIIERKVGYVCPLEISALREKYYCFR